MQETRSRLADDLSRLFNDAAGIAGGVRREVDTLVRSQFDRLLSNMDVVTREEFEAAKDMAAAARAETEALARRLAELEARMAGGTASGTASGATGSAAGPTGGAPPL